MLVPAEQWQAGLAGPEHRALLARLPVPFPFFYLLWSSLCPRLLTDYSFIVKDKNLFCYLTLFLCCEFPFLTSWKALLSSSVCLYQCFWEGAILVTVGIISRPPGVCLKHGKEQNLSPCWVLRLWVGWRSGDFSFNLKIYDVNWSVVFFFFGKKTHGLRGLGTMAV